MRRRLRKYSRQYSDGLIHLNKIRQSIQSWIGHAKHADTYALRSRILQSVAFQRAEADRNKKPPHPVVGASFEGFAMENILASAGDYESSFYRTGAGAEIDLVLRRGRRLVAFELKSSTVPRVTQGFWNALEDISPDEAYVVAPVKEIYPIKRGVLVTPLHDAIDKLDNDRQP